MHAWVSHVTHVDPCPHAWHPSASLAISGLFGYTYQSIMWSFRHTKIGLVFIACLYFEFWSCLYLGWPGKEQSRADFPFNDVWNSYESFPKRLIWTGNRLGSVFLARPTQTRTAFQVSCILGLVSYCSNKSSGICSYAHIHVYDILIHYTHIHMRMYECILHIVAHIHSICIQVCFCRQINKHNIHLFGYLCTSICFCGHINKHNIHTYSAICNIERERNLVHYTYTLIRLCSTDRDVVVRVTYTYSAMFDSEKQRGAFTTAAGKAPGEVCPWICSLYVYMSVCVCVYIYIYI